MTVETESKEIDSLRNVSLVSYPTDKIASYRFDRTPKIQVAGLRSRQRRRQAEAHLSLSPLFFLAFLPFLCCIGVFILAL
jgi:hypothetical protein